MEKFKDEQNTLFSVIFGHTLNVILGFIPRIHTEHFSLLDTRDRLSVTPEYDKNLECIETAESGVDKVVSSCEKNPNTLLENLDSVRECAGIFKRRVQKEYTSAKISSRHQLNEFSLGRSMIEMLGVLAIIGVLSIGGIAGYTKAMEKIHINKIVNMISDISTTIKTAYISQKEYDNFDSGLYGDDEWYKIQDMGLLPPEYIFELEGEKRIGLSSPLTLINPLGYTEEYEEGGFSALSIGVLVPQNLCVPLLTYDWRNADMKGIVIKDADPTTLGFWVLFVYANASDVGDYNCDENDDQEYYCIETKEQRFKPVSPAVAAKYCKSFAADTFGTGQMYVGFDLLADIKVPTH